MKNTWQILNKVINRNSKGNSNICNQEFNLNGKVTDNANDISNAFNDFVFKYRPKTNSKV